MHHILIVKNEKSFKIRNKNLSKKYYKIMKIRKKSLGLPKMCSNYTSKSQIIEIIEIQAKSGIISTFYPMMKSEIFSVISSEIP